MNIRDYFPLYKKNLALALPVILSQIGQVTVSLADTMMVGHVGTVDLAAASFSANVFMIGMVFCMGFSMGLTPLVGKVFIQKKETVLAEYLKNGLFVHVLITGLIILVLGVVSLFLNRMGQSELIAQKAFPYYWLLVVSLFPMMIFFSFKQFLEGLGNTKIAMYITLISNIINVGFNYLLIFGKFGFPELGLVGAGWATLIARICMPILLIPLLFKNKNYRSILSDAFRSRLLLSRMKEIISVGFPVGFQLIIEVTTFAVGAIMMGWIGYEALAGHQVAIGLASMTYMISVGISSGTTIRVSHEFGMHNYQQMKRIVYASLHLVVLFMMSMGVVFVVLRHQLPILFSDDPKVIEVAASLLIIAAFFQIFDGVQVVLMGALRGIADVTVPMFMAFLSYSLIGLPISYLFAFVFNFNEMGIWGGFLCGLGSAALLFAYRLIRLFRAL